MTKKDIETFTLKQVAEIAKVADCPSANDLWVRWEDHNAAMIEAERAAKAYMTEAEWHMPIPLFKD